MIRLFISFCLTLLVLGSLSSQNSNLIEVKKNGKWGLYDFTTSEVVIEPKYDLIGQQTALGIRIIKDDLIGMVSNQGELICEPQFLDIKFFNFQLYHVNLPDSTLNILEVETGKILLPPNNYKYIYPLNKDYFIVEIDGKNKIIDKNGKSAISNQKNSNEGIKYIRNSVVGNFITFNNLNNKQGLLQLNNGKEIIPAQYLFIRPLNKKYSKIMTDSIGYGVINHIENKIIIEAKYNDIKSLGEDYYVLEDTNKKQFIYHIKSKKKYPLATYYDHFTIMNQNYIRVKRSKYSGLINYKGAELIPVEYELIAPMKLALKPNLFLLKKGDLSGIYDPQNKQEVLSLSYTNINVTKNKFILVDHLNGKGLYNKHFEQLLKPEYSRIQIKNNSIKARKEKSVEILWLDDNQRITEQENYKEFYSLKIGYKKSSIIDSNKPKSKISFPTVNFEWVKSKDFHTKRAYKAINSDSILSAYLYKVNEATETHFTMVQEVDIFRKRNDLINGLCNKKYGFNPLHLFDGNKGVFIAPEQRFTGFRFDDFKQHDLPKMAVILEDGSFGMIAQDGTWLLDEHNQPLRASYIERMQNGMIRYAIGGVWATDRDTINSINSSFIISGKDMFSDYYLQEHYPRSSWSKKCYLTNAKWGYIDRNCKIVIPAQYEHASAFQSGKAVVSVNGKIGCINNKNVFLQDAKYSNIKITQHGTLILEKKNTESINYRMNKSGSQLIKDRYAFSDKIFEGLRRVKKDNKYGFIDTSGELKIPLEYDSLGNFNEGYALAKKDSSLFIINKNGKEILINSSFNIKGSVFNDLILVEKNNKYGFIDINGKVMIPIKFTFAFSFQKAGLARVVIGRKTGLIDNTGHFVLQAKDYELVFPFDENGLAIVQHLQYGLKGIINTNGTTIVKPYYEEIEPFKNGYAIVQKDYKFGYINLSGEEVIPTTNYQVYTANEGIMAVKESIYAFWEFRDSSNQRINNLKFTKPAMYKDGHAIITVVTDTQSYHRCLVNIEGDTLFFSTIDDQVYSFSEGLIGIKHRTVYTEFLARTSFHFKKLGEDKFRGKSAGYRDLSSFQDGVSIARPTGNYALIDKHGNYITSLKYKYIKKNTDNSYITIPEKLYGYTDKEGKIILPVEYDYVKEIYRDNRFIFHIEKGDQIGYMDTLGNWIWEMSR